MLQSPRGREVKGFSGQKFKKMVTGHFIRYSLLVKCRTFFCLQNFLKASSVVLSWLDVGKNKFCFVPS